MMGGDIGMGETVSEEETPDAKRRRVARESAARRRAGERLRNTVAECGTRSGVNRHRRLGEELCEPCKEAERKAWRDRNPPHPDGPRKPGRKPRPKE